MRRNLYQKNLLDAFGLFLYLQKVGSYQVIKRLFRSVQMEKKSILINEMSIGEIFHVTARTYSVEKAEALLPLLEVLPLKIVSNSLDDILRAARLRSRYDISTIGSLIVVTAEKENAILLTGDPEFKEVEGLIHIRWLI